MMLVASSKDAVAQERVDARGGFGGVERGRAGRDSANGRRSERGLRRVRDGFLRERMRQRLECGVVFEREVRAFVRFDQGENFRRLVRRCAVVEREPVRIREARGVALPGASVVR